MTLQEQVKADIITAMKSKETDKVSILRVISGELSTNSKKPVEDRVDEQHILRKLSKNAHVMGNDFELEIINDYLPKMLDENQTKVIVSDIINDNGYSTMKDMGKVMGAIKQLPTASQIDGKIASRIVKELLS